MKVAREKGADLVGFVDAAQFPQEEDNNLSPNYYLPSAKTVIVVGLKLVDALWNKLSGTYDVHSTNALSYLQHYNYDLLDYIAVQTARFIEDQGYDAYPIQARTDSKHERVFVGYFPFKDVASLAGLGVIGKNDMILTHEFGPRARLVVVITDVEFEGEQVVDVAPQTTDEVCGPCTLCIDSCPVKAISYSDGKAHVERRKCQGLYGCGPELHSLPGDLPQRESCRRPAEKATKIDRAVSLICCRVH
jgi:epoxyqueuosine reductase